jgi:hypothetical protein
MGADIEKLQAAIKRLHGVDSSHVETVTVKENFQGQTLWEGKVEIFDLHGHPQAGRAYAWTQDTDDADKPRRHVAVLHVAPVISPGLAVRAAILQDYRNRERPEEN